MSHPEMCNDTKLTEVDRGGTNPISSSTSAGAAQTVLGPVDASSLGVTLMHEHLLCDYAKNFSELDENSSRFGLSGLSLEDAVKLWHEPVSSHNAGHLRQYYNHNADNMVLDDWEMIADELEFFKDSGGRTVVDCSNNGIRDPKISPTHLVDISRKSGVNVIAGTGYYLSRVHPPDMDSRTIDSLEAEFTRDIREGIGKTSVRCGFIGEVGCSTVRSDNERKVLQAAARTHKRTGACITIHPGYGKTQPLEILQILRDAGADLRRVVMSHVDRGILSLDDIIAIAKTGAVVEFDMFGWGESMTHALGYGIEFPSDFVRCRMIKDLIERGFAKQIVMSQDIAFKTKMLRFGGYGYAYLLKSIVPFVKQIGISQENIDQILVRTPQRLLGLIP